MHTAPSDRAYINMVIMVMMVIMIMMMIIQTIPADSRAECARFGKWVQTLNIEIHQFSKKKTHQQSAIMITISVKIISIEDHLHNQNNQHDH